MIQVLNKILKKHRLFFVAGLAIALISLGSPFWTQAGLAISHQNQERARAIRTVRADGACQWTGPTGARSTGV